MHEIIRQRRQAPDLTQEQLAGKLGVSAPAVNKWEKAASFPDITLLPPLARALGVDLNTLLSFQEDLTEDDIGAFLNQLYETAQTQSPGAAFQLAQEKLREYPNSDLLAYSTAAMLAGILELWPEEGGEERRLWEDAISGLYERCVHSTDPQVREPCLCTLAGHCIQQGKLARAEELVDALPAAHRDRRALLARLRWAQERREEAWILQEQELFEEAHGLQTTLLQMVDWSLQEQDRPRAWTLADAAIAAGEALNLSDYAVLSAPFQLAAAEQDGPRALELLDRLLQSLTVPWDLSSSELYRHLPTKEAVEESQRSLIGVLLDSMERDPECGFLREQPGYPVLVEKYRRAAETAPEQADKAAR